MMYMYIDACGHVFRPWWVYYDKECQPSLVVISTCMIELAEGEVGSFVVRLSSVETNERHYSLSVK